MLSKHVLVLKFHVKIREVWPRIFPSWGSFRSRFMPWHFFSCFMPAMCHGHLCLIVGRRSDILKSGSARCVVDAWQSHYDWRSLRLGFSISKTDWHRHWYVKGTSLPLPSTVLAVASTLLKRLAGPQPVAFRDDLFACWDFQCSVALADLETVQEIVTRTVCSFLWPPTEHVLTHEAAPGTPDRKAWLQHDSTSVSIYLGYFLETGAPSLMCWRPPAYQEIITNLGSVDSWNMMHMFRMTVVKQHWWTQRLPGLVAHSHLSFYKTSQRLDLDTPAWDYDDFITRSSDLCNSWVASWSQEVSWCPERWFGWQPFRLWHSFFYRSTESFCTHDFIPLLCPTEPNEGVTSFQIWHVWCLQPGGHGLIFLEGDIAPLLGPIASAVLKRPSTSWIPRWDLLCHIQVCRSCSASLGSQKRWLFHMADTASKKAAIMSFVEVIWQVQPCIGSKFTTRSNGQSQRNHLYSQRSLRWIHTYQAFLIYIYIYISFSIPTHKNSSGEVAARSSGRLSHASGWVSFIRIGSKDMLNCTAFWSSSWYTDFFGGRGGIYVTYCRVKYIKTSYFPISISDVASAIWHIYLVNASDLDKVYNVSCLIGYIFLIDIC